MGNFIDLTGKRFGRYLVLNRDVRENKRKIWWNCICDCGTEKAVIGEHLKDGRVKSCGCWKGQAGSEHLKTHGMSKIPEYKTWLRMRHRCYNVNNQDYKDYGLRGITVCDEWLNDFPRFYSDMGRKPTEHHSIDRINNDSGYSPQNCRWADPYVQANNRRDTSRTRKSDVGKSGYRGVRRAKKRWSAHIGVNKKQIHIGTFDTMEYAIKARAEAEIIYWGKSS